LAEPLTNQPKLADAALVSEWRRLVVDSHESLVAERGEGWAAFWGSEDSQRGRYRVFLEELPLDGSDVLEVGCGFGDFLDCAALAGVRPRRYLGIDLSERILSVARRRHPGHEFAVLDILSEAPTFAPDYIIASGIMAVDLPEYEAYVLFTLRRLFALCRRGFALNFLSTATRSPDGKSRYVDPSWLLGTFQRHVDWSCRILHDYRQNDFTLVYKRRK
jgi:SAM-dependent methyltransferase